MKSFKWKIKHYCLNLDKISNQLKSYANLKLWEFTEIIFASFQRNHEDAIFEPAKEEYASSVTHNQIGNVSKQYNIIF